MNRRISSGPWIFLISEKVSGTEFRKALPELDILLEKGSYLKNSRSTTAALRDVPGCGNVFFKRTNNKGIRFTLRYLFRRARAFRAARAAERLLAHGIPTPAVIAVGEKRSLLYLHAGYLLTEAYSDAVTFADYYRHASDREAAQDRCISEGVKLIREMHGCGVTHGDCKFHNFYFRDQGKGACGTWDLDGAGCGNKLSDTERMRDLARFACSLMYEKSHLSKKEICRRVLETYQLQKERSITPERLEKQMDLLFPEK